MTNNSSRRIRALRLVIVVVIASLFSSVNSSAETWTAVSPGDLLTGSNWSGGTLPNSVGATATISTQPTNSGDFTLNGTMTVGTLNYSNSQNRSITGTGTLDMSRNSGFPEISVAGGDLTIGTTVSGPLGLNKNGSGTLILSGANTYQDRAVVSGGTLRFVTTFGQFPGGPSQAFAILNGATLDWHGEPGTGISWTSGIQLYAGGGVLSISTPNTSWQENGINAISGDGELTKAGEGSLIIFTTNSYSGPTSVTGGVLAGQTIANSGTNSSFGSGSAFTISNGATLWYMGPGGGPGITNRTITLGAGGGRISVTNEMTTSGVISGTSLTKTGAGVLQLDALNTYAGSTTINQGTLRIVGVGSGPNNRIPDSSAVTVSSGGTLDANGFYETIGSLVGSGNVLLSFGGALITGGDNTSTTFSGTISDTGSLTKTGTGTMTLSGLNSYVGTTTISGGTLSGNTIANNGSDSAFGRGNFSISNGAKLQYTGGTASSNRTVSLSSGGGTVDVANGSALTWSGAISGAGDFEKLGAGTMTLLAANNSYSGTTQIIEGALYGNSVANSGIPSSFGTGSSFWIANGATLGYLGPAASTDRNIVIPDSGKLSVTDSYSAYLEIEGEISGTGTLIKTGVGQVWLTNANTYTGGTLVSEGRLAAVNTTGSATGTGDITVYGGAELAVGLSTNAGAVSGNIANYGLVTFSRFDDSTYAGQITGNGNVQKFGLGALTLSGANTYSGGTDVAFGTLLAGNTTGSATGSGPVAVNAGATLGGTGTIAGPVSNAGIVAPGASAGTLHMLGDYAQSADGKLQIELGSSDSFDKLQVGGSVSLDGSLEVLLLSGYMPGSGAQFDILDFGSMTGTFSSIMLPSLAGGLQWNTSQLYTSGILSVGLPGDYNNNNVVDAADYVVWRKRGGSPAEYDLWRSQFGQSGGSHSEVGSWSPPAVPEPSGLVLAILAGLVVVFDENSRRKAAGHTRTINRA